MKSNIWCDEAYIIVQGQWNNSDGDFFMVNIYVPQDSLAKSSLWSRIHDFMYHHVGKYILFGDLSEVQEESERYGLIDLPMGGRYFTWMNKAGTKMSKLDRFLMSENVLDTYPDIKFFHPWLQRSDLDVIIKETWAKFSHQNVSTRSQFHTKLKELKKKIKVWHANVKQFERTRQQEVLTLLKSLEEKIDSGRASNEDREEQIKLLQECDDLDKMAAMDMVQKARIR
ncbi:RNA-directed DNA polymerase, eukaryota, reverse transcriptase zinc-binding domain protein [Tanacetum coccineum]